MPAMNEHLLQFIWQHLYFNKENLQTVSYEPVSIKSQGTLNSNQGPDFLHATIHINNVTWAGNVELHLKTSDWAKHGHTNDPHYQNIILHVVYEHDQKNISNIPILELKDRISTSLLKRYEQFMLQEAFVPCSKQAKDVSDIVWTSWKERMIAERLQQKSELISNLLHTTKQHWEEAFWQLLARSFGSPLNADAFEALAQTLPVTLLARHKKQIHQVEAMLMGQAGLLNGKFSEEYPIMLQKEYRFLQSKYKLKPVKQLLQFLRMRPSNFPTIRLAQLAKLIHQSSHLFSKVLEAKTVDAIRDMFTVTANDYWHYHYVFDEAVAFRKKQLGKTMVDHLLINCIIPVLFVYAAEHNDEPAKEKALQWLQQIKKEQNSITQQWEAIGITHQSAFDSQALLYLKKNYCNTKQCLQCAIGNNILRKTITS